MEVVVHGDLVQASDGNGLRAFAMGSKGIKEQARLYEASQLQSLINVAAIWQVASVVVAQKHLADISQKLDEIKAAVEGTSRFLISQRRARIQANFEYLQQARHAIQGGELPVSVRIELEGCERDLIELQRHLEMEYRHKAQEKVKRTETFGTGNLSRDLGKKLADLESISADLSLCVKTRIAAWHVLSLFPGDQRLKNVRRETVQAAIESFRSILPLCDIVRSEIKGVKHWTNRAVTLEKRRLDLGETLDSALRMAEQSLLTSAQALNRSSGLLNAESNPTRILLQLDERGTLVEARRP